MKIVLIGAGNLATNLGKALLSAGHDIVQVFSRTVESATALAQIAGGAPVTDIEQVRADADLYVVSVKDSVLGELLPRLCKGKETKVFYPMQTFSKSKEVDFSEIPCFIEANDDYAHTMIADMAHELSGNVYELSSADRKYLHLSAVFACNFVNHCYAISEKILADHGIPFDVMLPLIDETARKVHELSPREAQTGPAVRFDENVIRMQAALLKNQPQIKDIYERLSLGIHRFSKK